MKTIEPVRVSTRYRVLVGVLALLGTGLVLVSTSRYGAGLSPDSVGYIGTARNIMGGAGVTLYNGGALVSQPPLYPAALALAGGLLRTDPLLLARATNALVFGLIVYLGGLLAFEYLPRFPVFGVIGTLGILLSVPLFTVSVMAWSEPLLILFTILSLEFAHSYLEEKGVASLVFLSLSVTLACLTRYIGVVLTLWGALIVVVAHRDALSKGMARLSLFAFISVVPIGIWLIRNYVVSGAPFGPRASSMHSLPQNLRLAYEGLATWYIPSIVPDARPALMLLVTGIAVVGVVGARNNWGSLRASLRQIGPLVLFVALYTTFLVISSTIANYDAIGDRLLSPIYVPATLALLILAQALAERYGLRLSGTIAGALVTMVLAVWLVYLARTTVLNAANQFSRGSGYGSVSWKDSQTIRYVAANSSTCPIYTNGADAVYLLDNLKVRSIPSKSSGADVIADISSLEGTWPEEEKACIVWFHQITWRTYLFTPEELTSVSKLEKVIQLSDGTIYMVSRK